MTLTPLPCAPGTQCGFDGSVGSQRYWIIPLLNSSLGTVCVICVVSRLRCPSYARKKNSRSFFSGPPKVAPNVLRIRWGGVLGNPSPSSAFLLNQSFASPILDRLYS